MFYLFCLHFWFEILASEFVELCLGMVISKTSSCYAHIILAPHFTKTFLFTPLAEHTRHYGCITITDLDRPSPVGCSCSLQTCTVVYSISFTRMNQESLCEISLLCHGKTKLSYYTSIQSCHLVCKFWCQNFCVCEGQRGVSTVKWMVFEPVVPGPF
jgi:hypothetical protein